MMNEAIERARKRAQAASSRHPGLFSSSSHHHHHNRHSSYQSPLGAGFTFDRNRPKSDQYNPYSIKGKQRLRQQQQQQQQQKQKQQSRNDEDDESKTTNNDRMAEDGDHDGDFRILYEESHFNMNGGWSSPRGDHSSSGGGGGGGFGGFASMQRMRGGKEYVVERMKNRRKYRVRERGEPNPYHQPHRRHHDENNDNRETSSKGIGGQHGEPIASGCVVM